MSRRSFDREIIPSATPRAVPSGIPAKIAVTRADPGQEHGVSIDVRPLDTEHAEAAAVEEGAPHRAQEDPFAGPGDSSRPAAGSDARGRGAGPSREVASDDRKVRSTGGRPRPSRGKVAFTSTRLLLPLIIARYDDK
jgi:hypothetical protein